MNTAPDRKKVAAFLFKFNYMQGPWRLDEARGGERLSSPQGSGAATTTVASMAGPRTKRAAAN